MLNDDDAANMAEALADEPAEVVIFKQTATIVLTRNRALKLRTGTDAGRVAKEEAAWLNRFGIVMATGTTFALSNGDTGSAVVMPRLADRSCMARRLAERSLTSQHVKAVAERLTEISSDAEMGTLSRQQHSINLLANLDKQISSLRDDEAGLPMTQIRGHVSKLLNRWAAPSGVGMAGHRNAFSSNIFVDESVQILDPRLESGDFTTLPWFGDAATVDTDLLLHGWDSSTCLQSLQYQLTDMDHLAYVVAMVVKTLVRYRFARLESSKRVQREGRSGFVDWIGPANRLIIERAPALLNLLRKAESPLQVRV